MEGTGIRSMTIEIAYLGIGSNLGNRTHNLLQAIKLISRHAKIKDISSVYQTRPWGHSDQPYFLNIVCRLETTITAINLLTITQCIEKTIGRTPTFLYGPRLIDIDILMYGDQIVETEQLKIPHPHINERAFVLTPFSEIAASLIHPITGRSISEHHEEVEGKDNVVFLVPLTIDLEETRY